VVTGLAPMLRRLIGENLDFATVPAPDLGAVKADPSQLEQVIVNLAVNARDAMPQGGTLTIETGNVELDEAHTRRHPGASAGRFVMLAIRDTGHGMDAAVKGGSSSRSSPRRSRARGPGWAWRPSSGS